MTPPAGRKPPRAVAMIDADRCTGCRACVEVCPVDCIAVVATHSSQPGWQAICQIDAQRCTGCQWCIRLPRKRGGNPAYTLRVCPWDAIAMVATAEAACASRPGGSCRSAD